MILATPFSTAPPVASSMPDSVLAHDDSGALPDDGLLKTNGHDLPRSDIKCASWNLYSR